MDEKSATSGDGSRHPTKVNRVLIPYDGSELAEAALYFAAGTFPSASIKAFHVVEPFASHTAAGTPVRDDWHDIASERATAICDDVRSIAGDLDRSIEANWEYGRPAQTILRYIDEHSIDHVVMGSHGRSGIERLLLGSVAETVIRRSSVPVTVIRDDDSPPD